jgi:hypothetical protein
MAEQFSIKGHPVSVECHFGERLKVLRGLDTLMTKDSLDIGEMMMHRFPSCTISLQEAYQAE